MIIHNYLRSFFSDSSFELLRYFNHELNFEIGFSPLWEIEDIAANINIVVLQVDNQEIGVAVRQVETIEQHDWQKLQPPEGLFPSHILSYVQGYLTEASSIILDAPALVKAFSS
ncbi:MAG: hypothetical protein BRC33_03195 [Cyanobacteria bacterium SW_9_44_58]|nr:MAG: hypothetical protein BRC33_03195 [Cyanobacteria bacterium SW_9_44_58]